MSSGEEVEADQKKLSVSVGFSISFIFKGAKCSYLGVTFPISHQISDHVLGIRGAAMKEQMRVLSSKNGGSLLLLFEYVPQSSCVGNLIPKARGGRWDLLID